MKSIPRTFVTGLATVLPIVATFYLLGWLVMAAESILSAAVQFILPKKFYWPGLGVVIFVVLVFLTGLFMRTWVAQKLFSWGEALLYRTPIVKMVYGALRDFFGFMTEHKKKDLQQVVSVQIGNFDMRLIGFVTRDDLSSMPHGINRADTVAVYLPFSYQIGGYMVLVPRSSIQPVEMSVEDAMRLALTAGISTKAKRTYETHNSPEPGHCIPPVKDNPSATT